MNDITALLFSDAAGNVHWKNGIGSSANPRLYTVQYHRKDMAYLRPGACYFEWEVDEDDPTQWKKQYFVGYRRGSDATLIYAMAQWWNGCFGRQGSDAGPYYVHSKKTTKKKTKSAKQDEEEAESADEWGADWEQIPDGTVNTDENWGPEFANPLVGEEDGSFKTVSTNKTLVLASGGPQVTGERAAAQRYGIDFTDGKQEFPQVIKTLEGAIGFGLTPKQKLECLLKVRRSDNFRIAAAWKMPRAVVIAAA